ncbi:hypothetical protein HU762_03795 [Pseudomonas sp. SWRI92]|nr:hypothetical protein [Pseudomonas sp. SWRI92]
MSAHPHRARTDIVLRRVARNHYSLILPDRVETLDPDGDCFFNAIARGLNEGQSQETFSTQGLRDAAADYIDQHPELSPYLPVPQATTQQVLLNRAPPLKSLLGRDAFGFLTRIVHGGPNPHGLFRPTLNYLRLYGDRVNRSVLAQAQDTDLPPQRLEAMGHSLSPRAPGPLDRGYGPLFSSDEKRFFRRFLQDVLLEPVQGRHIDELLDDSQFVLSHHQLHIKLEYGVTSWELAWNHPVSREGYVMYDEAVHGHLDEDELEEVLEGATLVTRNDLEDLSANIKRITGRDVDNDKALLGLLVEYNSADATRDLYRSALRRFPDLQRRAGILLESRIIAFTLADKLSVALFASWLRNPAITEARLRMIAEYANTRYDELLSNNHLDIDWMRPFSDRNLQNLFTHQQALTGLLRFLGGARSDAGDIGMPAVAGLFRSPDQAVSNTRVAMLFNTPGLWDSLQLLPQDMARQIWNELIGPYFSDANIQRTLRHPGALGSGLNFAVALRDSLEPDEARVNLIVQGLLSIGQGRAQQYLYNFDFPTNRLGHSRLDFALYLENYLTVPEWAWQYAREGVTPDSLRPFGAMKRHDPGKLRTLTTPD